MKNTFTELGAVAKHDGRPYVLVVKDVPLDAFWSVIVYDGDSFIPENSLGVYSYNNVTVKPTQDSSTTVHFGACEDVLIVFQLQKVGTKRYVCMNLV